MRILISLLLGMALNLPMSIVLADASSSIFRFQSKLADQGNAEAQYKVGEMYELGKGVSPDNVKAREWLEKAANQGHRKAAYRVLLLDIKTQGMNAKRGELVNEITKEANAGSPDAQYFLGKMYASGLGKPKDLAQARILLNKAAFNGVPEAEFEAIAVDEEIARSEERLAKLRVEEERKKREADELAKREQDAQKAKERELAARREADQRAREAEQKRKERERAAAAASAREQREMEAAEREAAKAEAAAASAKPSEQAPAKKVDEKAVFESDPCKGKTAKFLSICK